MTRSNGVFDDRPVNTEHWLFEPIWQVIKNWDIERRRGEGYAGATGSDAQRIIDAIEASRDDGDHSDRP